MNDPVYVARASTGGWNHDAAAGAFNLNTAQQIGRNRPMRMQWKTLRDLATISYH